MYGFIPAPASLVNDPLGITHDDVRFPHAEGHNQVGAGDGGSPGAVDDDPDLFDVLVDDVQGVQERRRGDNGGAVLVVMEDRDVHALFQLLLDLEALRGLDVLQVDPAKGRFEEPADLYDLIGVFRVDLYIEHIDVGKTLEEDSLPFHDRLARQCPDIAEAQDRGAVRQYRHQVPFCGVSVSIIGVPGDFQARFRNPRRICQGEVTGSYARLGGDYLDFPFSSA